MLQKWMVSVKNEMILANNIRLVQCFFILCLLVSDGAYFLFFLFTMDNCIAAFLQVRTVEGNKSVLLSNWSASQISIETRQFL